MMVFVTGGARSGKSTFAQNLGESRPGRRLFIATAEAFDEEMERRIKIHREQRGDRWDTCEEAIDLGGVIGSARGEYETILIDCLTVWMSNLMHRYEGRDKELSRMTDAFFQALEPFPGVAIVVSNEVGMGIVPDNRLAREYRDLLGFLNQRAARIAEEVYLLCSGIPVKVK